MRASFLLGLFFAVSAHALDTTFFINRTQRPPPSGHAKRQTSPRLKRDSASSPFNNANTTSTLTRRPL